MSISRNYHLLNQRNYYESNVVRRSFPTLTGSKTADVVIVGAGFSGLSAAVELAMLGYKVVVLEAGRVCSGASGRNGGQAIVGYACGQEFLEKHLGKDQAHSLWQMSLEAIALIDQRITTYAMECERVHGYLYVANSVRKAKQLAAEARYMEKNYGFVCDGKSGNAVHDYINSPRYCMGLYEKTSGHLHPLKYGLALAELAHKLGVEIYENSSVDSLQMATPTIFTTAKGRVSASYGLFAGNTKLAVDNPSLLQGLTRRIMPVGTYMVATAPLGDEVQQALIPDNAAVCDNNFVLDYFRFAADKRLLFGGRVSYTGATPARLHHKMQQRIKAIFPQLENVEITYDWGGFVDISMNRAPDFGRLPGYHNLYYLQGFSGHGVALANLAGKLVAEAINTQAQRFDIFASIKHRAFPGGDLLRTPLLALGMLYYRLRDFW